MKPAAPLLILVAAALAGCVSGPRERPRTAAVEPGGYIVRAGDTLLAIARDQGVDMAALAQRNGLTSPYVIRVGQRLAIPSQSRHRAQYDQRQVVQPVPRAAPRPQAPAPSPPPPPPPPAPYVAPSPPPPAAAGAIRPPTGAPRMVWPADGPVSKRFSGSAARGIVIASHSGVAVRSAATGTVMAVFSDPRGGQQVLVDHGGGWITAYGQLGRLTVRQGERVAAGARLGFIAGGSGLPFELRLNDRAVDPEPLLPPRF